MIITDIRDEKRMTLDKISSFRINSKNLDKLKTQAKSNGVSLNTLVNEIFVNYLQWDMTATKAGWVVVLSEVLRSLMNELDDKILTI